MRQARLAKSYWYARFPHGAGTKFTPLLTSRSRSRDFTGSSHNKPPGVCSPSRHVANADDQHTHRCGGRGDGRPRLADVDARLRLVPVLGLLRVGS